MTNIKHDRLLLLILGITTASITIKFSQEEITDFIRVNPNSNVAKTHTVPSGLTFASLGLSLISGLCFLGFSITFIGDKK
ncbi:hypothetical protein [uncultured Tenacibaculum sp.]|uniref:hypothetical protein n=1 Tax=uncultured Tenacibaculum sp. TaxID=174713 RepID=UPI00261D5D6B|nr:hypothetical protein [uncultured Tenacibaculum sp.]